MTDRHQDRITVGNTHYSYASSHAWTILQSTRHKQSVHQRTAPF